MKVIEAHVDGENYEDCWYLADEDSNDVTGALEYGGKYTILEGHHAGALRWRNYENYGSYKDGPKLVDGNGYVVEGLGNCTFSIEELDPTWVQDSTLDKHDCIDYPHYRPFIAGIDAPEGDQV